MKLRFETPADFEAFKAELKNRLDAHQPRSIDTPDLSEAAVLIPLMNKGGEACVLVTKRTQHVATHKGQMSLPGGRYDDEDPDTLSTALRETHEEVGIMPEHVEILGRFDDFISIAGFHVATYIGAVPHPYEYVLSTGEIEAYVEVPLSLFASRSFDRVEQVSFQGKQYKVYYYLYEGFEIWGLTARILTDFAAKILAPCREDGARQQSH